MFNLFFFIYTLYIFLLVVWLGGKVCPVCTVRIRGRVCDLPVGPHKNKTANTGKTSRSHLQVLD